MNCRACGYEETYSSGGTYPVQMPSERGDFISLAPLGLVGDDGMVQRQTVPIAACPKCGTIRLVSADGS